MAGQKEAIAQILANIRGEDTDALREASIGALTADVDTTPSLSATIGQALGAALPLLFVDGQARGLAAGTSAKAFESAQAQSRQSLESQRKKLEKIAGLGLEVAGKRDEAKIKRAEKLDERQFQLERDNRKLGLEERKLRELSRSRQLQAEVAQSRLDYLNAKTRSVKQEEAPLTEERAYPIEQQLAQLNPQVYGDLEPGWSVKQGHTAKSLMNQFLAVGKVTNQQEDNARQRDNVGSLIEKRKVDAELGREKLDINRENVGSLVEKRKADAALGRERLGVTREKLALNRLKHETTQDFKERELKARLEQKALDREHQDEMLRFRAEEARAMVEAKTAEEREQQERVFRWREKRAAESHKFKLELLKTKSDTIAKEKKLKTVPASQAEQLGGFKAGYTILDQLSEAHEDLRGGWFGEFFSNKLSRAASRGIGAVTLGVIETEEARYTNDSRVAAQIIGRGLEKGRLTDADYEEKYMKFMPSWYDSATTAKRKLGVLREMLGAAEAGLLESLGNAGYDISQYETQLNTVVKQGMVPTQVSPNLIEAAKRFQETK